ncbi:Nn.00g015050.m01.CDS01 [Neocucurbitaria sp. VM-36]
MFLLALGTCLCGSRHPKFRITHHNKASQRTTALSSLTTISPHRANVQPPLKPSKSSHLQAPRGTFIGMGRKRNHDPEDDYVPSKYNSNYGSQPKRAQTEVRSPSPDNSLSSSYTSLDCESDFVNIDESSEDELAPTPKKQVQKTTRPYKSHTPYKRTRYITRNSLDVAFHSSSSRDSTSKVRKNTKGAHELRPRDLKKYARLAAEVANLANYNEPPVLRSRLHVSSKTTSKRLCTSYSNTEGESIQRTSASTRETVHSSDQLHVQGARIIKPQAKVSYPRKRGDKLLAEVAQLQLWHGWVSEEQGSSSDSDPDDETYPRSYSRRYPPKVTGSQNLPWSELPGEIRNKIYEYAMSNEEEKMLNVIHYPNGIPRRSVRGGITSPTNFAHSYWGFTQTCQKIRNEFTPWLLNKRRVRTLLATLNDYIETFHRPGDDEKRAGWIQPICCGAPLPGTGVEVLSILKHKHANSHFHIQLTPMPISVLLEDLAPMNEPDQFDELRIVRDMDETFTSWSGNILQTAGLQSIHITSVVRENQSDFNNAEEDETLHEILIKLDVGQPQMQNITHNQQLQSLSSFIFASKFSEKPAVKLKASFDSGGVARWVVRRPGTIDMQWKARETRGKNIFQRLTLASDEPIGFLETSLE